MEIPKELLSKEFLSQFKSEEDVSKFLTTLHSRVLEQMLEGEMDAHLGYEKHSASGINTGNSRNGKYPKKIQTEYGESSIEIPRDRQGEFEPVIVPKHQSRGLSIEKLVISLYAILITVTDNLNGFTGTIKSVFPDSTTQICVVHQIRNSCKYVVWKEKKEFTSDLKNIYNAPTKEAALLELNMFEQKWGAKYPYAIRSYLKTESKFKLGFGSCCFEFTQNCG